MVIEQDRSVVKSGSVFRCLSALLALGLSVFGFGTPCHAQLLEYGMGPEPEWVIPVEWGHADEKRLGQITNGAYYLLSDVQVRVDEQQRTVYRHVAGKAINAEGVSALANIEIGFDPSYQTLELHSIELIREGRVMPKLATATVRVLQRETELERRIYDGSKSANIFLEDVRVGDIVSFAYSVRGRNPVFKGRDFSGFSLQYSIPVARIHARLVVPEGQSVDVVTRHSEVEATVSVSNGIRDYRWDLRDVAALSLESDVPEWHDPYPMVEWTEFESWAAVSQWAQPLYAVPVKIGSALEAEVERIRKAESSPEGRLLAALRFAQGEIRYLGIEIGPGSHEPNPPDLVLERRFGDCKDKTLLALTLLDRLGIKAQAALVNTQKRRALADRQPSPGQFDHVIVRAELDGKPIWLDPTRATQNADFAHLLQPDFDLALVVAPDTHDLVSMKQDKVPASSRSVHVTFDAKAGFEEPVSLKVVTTVDGESADSMRTTLARSNFDELQKSYLNFYAATFPGLSIVEPMLVNDDERRNRIVLSERYSIPKFSAWSESSQRHVAIVPVPDIDEVLRSPTSPVRSGPLRLAHPSDVKVVTETVLPSTWTIEPSTAKVEDPAFTFERTIKPRGERFFITDHFRSLADEVAAVDTGRYASNLARAREETGFQLYWSGDSPMSKASGFDRVNWMIVLVGLMAIVMWIWVARRVYQYDPPATGVNRRSQLCGLRGWLILPGIGTLILPFAMLAALVASLDAFASDSWAYLTTFGSKGYHPLWAPALLFSLAGTLGIMVLGVVQMILFFSRRSSLPIVYIWLQWIAMAHWLVEILLLNAIPEADTSGNSQFAGSLVSTAGWTLYFLQSERVKNTFVVRLKQPIAAAPEAPRVPEQTFSLG